MLVYIFPVINVNKKYCFIFDTNPNTEITDSYSVIMFKTL